MGFERAKERVTCYQRASYVILIRLNERVEQVKERVRKE